MNFKHKNTSYMPYVTNIRRFVWLVILKVWVKYFDLRDFSMSFTKKRKGYPAFVSPASSRMRVARSAASSALPENRYNNKRGIQCTPCRINQSLCLNSSRLSLN